MKELSVEKQIYLCKYHDIDNYITISMNMSKEQIDGLIEKYKQNRIIWTISKHKWWGSREIDK